MVALLLGECGLWKVFMFFCLLAYFWFQLFFTKIDVFVKFVPFYHRSWVCCGNFEVFHSINGTHRQSSHCRNSCSSLQTRAGISGSSLFVSEDRLTIISSVYATCGLSHGKVVQLGKVHLIWQGGGEGGSEIFRHPKGGLWKSCWARLRKFVYLKTNRSGGGGWGS